MYIVSYMSTLAWSVLAFIYLYEMILIPESGLLQECGPRFTLKLLSLQHGTFDSKFGEYEWVHKVNDYLRFWYCLMLVVRCNDSFADCFICICSQIWTPVEGVFSCKLMILIYYWNPFWRGANQPMDVSNHYHHNELKQKTHHFCGIRCYWASVTGREIHFNWQAKI